MEKKIAPQDSRDQFKSGKITKEQYDERVKKIHHEHELQIKSTQGTLSVDGVEVVPEWKKALSEAHDHFSKAGFSGLDEVGESWDSVLRKVRIDASGGV